MRPRIVLIASISLAALVVVGLILLRSGDEVGRGHTELGARGGADGSTARRTDAEAAPTQLQRPARTGDASGDGAPNATNPPPSDAEFRGRIVDARGVGVAEADVYLAPANVSRGVPLESLDPARFAWSRRTRARTDATGRFHVASSAAGELRMSVRAHGFAPYDRTLSMHDAARELGDVALEDGVVLNGRVVDARGNAIEGAVLRRLEPHADAVVVPGLAFGAEVAVTDTSGAFRVDELASGPWRLLVLAEGRASKVVRGVIDRPGAEEDASTIVLEEGAEIRGRVRDAPPRSVDSLWISAVPRRSPTESDSDSVWALTARTAACAADGSFTVRGLQPGATYGLAAREGEAEPKGITRTAWVDAVAGASDVELAYTSRTTIVCQVVDASTSAPVTGMEIHVGQAFMLALKSDDGGVRHYFPDGRVRFEHVYLRRVQERPRVVIDAPGYRSATFEHAIPTAGEELDLGALKLERSPMVAVRVLDEASGAPVSEAHVSLDASGERVAVEADGAPPPDEPASFLRSAVTDANGDARLNSAPGERATLTVIHDAYAPYASEPIELSATGDVERTVRLSAGGRVSIEVLDGRDRPVQDVPILHESPIDASRPGAHRRIESTRSRTDANGRAAFERLEPGAHRFAADRSVRANWTERDAAAIEAAIAVARWSEVEVANGGTQPLTLHVPSRSRLNGRVTERGEPLAGATLRLTPRTGGTSAPGSGAAADELDLPLDARANGKGEYKLLSIEVGAYLARVYHPSRAMPFECELRVGEDGGAFDVDLPVATIEGRLVDDDGRPVAGVRVVAERAEEARVASSTSTTHAGRSTPIGIGSPGARVTSGADGTYVLRGVRTDVDLIVTIESNEYQPVRSGPVRADENHDVAPVDLRLARGAALDVSVLDAAGRPAASRAVRASRGNGGGDVAAVDLLATTDATGIAHFKRLPPGTWRVRAEPATAGADGARAPLAEATVEVEVGRMNTAHLALP